MTDPSVSPEQVQSLRASWEALARCTRLLKARTHDVATAQAVEADLLLLRGQIETLVDDVQLCLLKKAEWKRWSDTRPARARRTA